MGKGNPLNYTNTELTLFYFILLQILMKFSKISNIFHAYKFVDFYRYIPIKNLKIGVICS